MASHCNCLFYGHIYVAHDLSADEPLTTISEQPANTAAGQIMHCDVQHGQMQMKEEYSKSWSWLMIYGR